MRATFPPRNCSGCIAAVGRSNCSSNSSNSFCCWCGCAAAIRKPSARRCWRGWWPGRCKKKRGKRSCGACSLPQSRASRGWCRRTFLWWSNGKPKSKRSGKLPSVHSVRSVYGGFWLVVPVGFGRSCSGSGVGHGYSSVLLAYDALSVPVPEDGCTGACGFRRGSSNGSWQRTCKEVFCDQLLKFAPMGSCPFGGFLPTSSQECHRHPCDSVVRRYPAKRCAGFARRQSEKGRRGEPRHNRRAQECWKTWCQGACEPSRYSDCGNDARCSL